MKTILVLMDSLNRHMLKLYNPEAWAITPHIDSFARDCAVFDNHWIGSAPCMPARRDIFTGRLNFLERGWGPIEPFDVTLQETLRKNGTFTHIVTDHTHYVELGGENYLQLFNTWDIVRGQEYDAWASRVTPPRLPDKYYGKASTQYELNSMRFKKEEDFPTPRTFASACEWIKDNKDEDNFFLMVEAFDPHEPFDCPKEYLDMYEDDYKGPRFNWSGYSPASEPPEALEHLRKQYAATLTMADRWFGKLIDTLKDNGMYEDSLIILTTDHGHLLGEHGWTGKNLMPAYNELAHIPLFVHLPQGRNSGKHINALTQNIDLMPTILSFHKADIPHSVKGHSWMGLLEGRVSSVRDTAIYGWHGKAVNITDGKHTYFRAPASPDNNPCFNYCAIPTTLWRFLGKDCAGEIEMGRFLKHTEYPVYRIPLPKGQAGREDVKNIMETLLFDIEKDYKQQNPLKDASLEADMLRLLVAAMLASDAPGEQFERLGIDRGALESIQMQN